MNSKKGFPVSGIRAWMFLNTRWDDFIAEPVYQDFHALPWPPARCSVSPKPRPAVPKPWQSSPSSCIARVGGAGLSGAEHDDQSYVVGYLQSLSPLNLNPEEHYLWSYFDSCIAPQCVQDPKLNPYRDVVLRIAASSQEGSLLPCVLAVAANQLHSIGRVEYKPVMWLHRARALSLLRSQVSDLAHTSNSDSCNATLNEQIVASTLMLCFFESCSRSWTIHADFARDLLSKSLHGYELLSVEKQNLHHFAFAYFVSHDVFAATAGSRIGQDRTVAKLCRSIHEPDILALTGCTRQLLVLSPRSALSAGPCAKGKTTAAAFWMICCGAGTTLSDNFISWVMKRLAALLYLYGRLDDAGPQEPHMVRTTRQILGLLQSVSLRTNTLLWPLFIVGVLGIRSEDDEDRRLLLEKLAALQETRQLGHVKKARAAIEDVWGARELHTSQAGKGWSIIKGKCHAISLA
ncbi:hypothetical protein PG994_002498 [Apiospora phragmitis]|uniref:Uncharacterized protein n=1 Tax=Apiospora phragmitis TaxID=2905665 RepID=A0ABR1W591_9PEZI